MSTNKEIQPTFRSVAVIGVNGHVGGFLTRTLAEFVRFEAVVRQNRWRDEALYPQVRCHSSIADMLQKTAPELVIMATPNPTEEALKEIAQHAQKPFTLILPQNGVDVVPTAQKVLASKRDQVSLIRASLATNVSRNKAGELVYNKKRIGLAAVDNDQDKVQKAQELFAQAGFDVRVFRDYQSMEWSKLLTNLYGSTTTMTNLSPKEALSDRENFAMEHRALQDRIKALEAAGIKLSDFWNVSKLRWLARVPTGVASLFRGIIAQIFASERNNQPSAAARQISEGARKVESTDFYHKPMLDLGRELGAEHGTLTPLDKVLFEILKRHQRGEVNKKDPFDLSTLEPAERRKLLLEAYDLQTQRVFYPSIAPIRVLLESIYSLFARGFEVKGEENLEEVMISLEEGKSVAVLPVHYSHLDHPTVKRGLKKVMGRVFEKHPFYVIANTKFEGEFLSWIFSRAYPHTRVATLKQNSTEEDHWKAKFVNNRTSSVTEELLEEAGIWLIYPEGGRNKTGTRQLQEPAKGVDYKLASSQYALAVAVIIRNTDKMYPPGRKIPHFTHVEVEFLRPRKTGPGTLDLIMQDLREGLQEERRNLKVLN
ncbi:1-acyl-sn-glycerol-3-phosphate acyltransferase [Candidatus Daviesbacteria bacterium]|nr:1-acyl-sn-glycerol-3-phosphate acyltransferase [Candidatus Daviesbacteria bacterium]